MTLQKKQLLLIEDDLIDQMAFTRMFESQMKDFSYTVANSIKEAKSYLQSINFDIVISDFNLADGTTFDLLNDLSDTPIIIITGNEDDATVSKAKLEIGAAACFTKDFDLDYLQKIPSTIDSILNKKSFTLNLHKKVHFKNPIKTKEVNTNYSLGKIYEIFDGNKKLVKETIQVFIKYKPQELEALKKSIFVDNDCSQIQKIVHKMQSGFRVFNMNAQEQTAGEIEKLAIGCKKNKEERLDNVDKQFQKLTHETQIAIELLRKELSNF